MYAVDFCNRRNSFNHFVCTRLGDVEREEAMGMVAEYDTIVAKLCMLVGRRANQVELAP